MNLRKDNNGAALKAWKKQGPGHIARPLRLIGERTNGRDHDGRVIESAQYTEARRSAARGLGDEVQRIARSVL
jgi:hypothetical protein